MRRLALVCALALGLVTVPVRATSPYPLDAIARTLAPGEKLPCQRGELDLVGYRGTHLRYQKPLRVHPAFVPQLAAFEEIVIELSREHFGRTPARIVHMGGYACRVMRRYPDWVSEHALGNAVDVAGFDFGPLSRGVERDDLPRPLRRAFEVRLERHWHAEGANAKLAAFLRALAERIIARPDIFPVVLGPAWPGHKNHFHFDRAPYRVVEVFEAGEVSN